MGRETHRMKKKVRDRRKSEKNLEGNNAGAGQRRSGRRKKRSEWKQCKRLIGRASKNKWSGGRECRPRLSCAARRWD